MRFLITLCLVLIFCNSCTIEKRLYGRGYHISWNKRYKGGKNKGVEKKLEEEELTKEETIDSTEIIVDEMPETDSIQPTKEAKKEAEREKYPDLPKGERKFEPLGVLAFKILLLNIPIGIIGENAVDPRIIGQCEFMFLTILILTFILAVISMVRYLRNPRHYRFNIFAIIVILVGLFYLVMFILGNYQVTFIKTFFGSFL